MRSQASATFRRRSWSRRWCTAKPRRIERAEPSRIEARQIDRAGAPVDDELRHRLAGRRRVEDAPDAVAGGDIDVPEARHRTDQRQAVLSNRTITGLPGDDVA